MAGPVKGTEPRFAPLAAAKANGRPPFLDFWESESDVETRRQILSRIDHVSQLARDEYQPPNEKQVDGHIWRMKIGPQIRILFSLEAAQGAIVIYGGERKKGRDKIDPALIAAAQEMRAAWLRGRPAEPLPTAQLMKNIKRKKFRLTHDEK